MCFRGTSLTLSPPVVSDVENAKKWAKKLWDTNVALAGPDSEVAKCTQPYVDKPEAHPLFATAPKATLAPPDF